MVLEFSGESWISHVKYNEDTKAMSVTMKGKSKNVYEMSDVPYEVYMDFKKSSSRGTYFNRNLKGKYQHAFFT